jgi:methionine-rich copper-binding protein CopC
MTTNLINHLGGTNGFGEAYLARNDDSYTSRIDIRSVFPNGLNFFGEIWTGIYINNNGNITFTGPSGSYTPTAITGNTSNPIIAAFWADVDTRGTPGGITPGGTSTGTNLTWYDLNPATGTITVTWDDVGYFRSSVDKLNAFQLQLVRVNDSDFNIVFRYEDINWTTGDASFGTDGLGGQAARAGYSSGDGVNFFELPQSGNQDAVLAMESSSNVAQPGMWAFQVRSGTPVIEVSIDDVAQAEGNGPGSRLMTFAVILSSPTSQPVQIDYFTQTGTADRSDFIPVAGTVIFAPGQTRQTVTVEVLGDTTPEPDETFTITLANAINTGISDGQATGTIVGDDGMAISDVQITEGTGSGITNATFTVTLLTASTSTVTVNFATAAGTATEGTDYTAASGTLSFAPGEITKTITVGVLRDGLAEDNETFNVQLSGAVGTTLMDATGTATLVNDDGFVVNDVAVLEGSGNGTSPLVFDVSLLSAQTSSTTVDYQLVGGSATAGTDFVAASGTLTFAAGQTLQQVTVQVNKDALTEADETFQLVLSNATGTGIADASGTATIQDDDGVFVSDAVVVEGYSGTTSVMFYTVTLASASSSTVSINYATRDGTATAGSDYIAASGTLSFAPGEISKNILVMVIGDRTPEADETLSLQLSSAVGANLSASAATGTIRNDDGMSIRSAGSVTEGNTGTQTVSFQVSMMETSSQPVRVNYATVDGTATAGSDYVSTAGTLTFAPGELSKTITVPINGDTLYEPNETFRMVLSNPVGSWILNGSSSGTATITNDDVQPLPVMTISDVSQAEGSGSGTSGFHFFVTLSRAATSAVTVNYTTASGTATSGSDFTPASGTLTFAVGETVKEVVVPVVRDATQETSETFTLALSGLTGSATLQDASGLGTLLNDDVTVAVNDVNVTEGNAGTTAATFSLSLSGASPLPVSVNFSTADGSASAGTDYQAATGTVTFAPGETVKRVTVLVNSDTLVETAENFQLVLSSPVYVTILDGQGTGTINNNDITLDDYAATTATTGHVNIAGTTTGQIETVNDRDWFSVSLTAGQIYNFGLNAAASAGLSNPYLTLYNSSGTALASNDDGGSNLNALLGYTATASGTYYLEARAYSTQLGGYILSATTPPPPDTTAPTVLNFNPADEAIGAGIGSNVVLSFSEAVQRGTGSIVLKTAAGAVIATYDAATSGNLSFSGSTLTINPAADLAYSTAYKVEFAAGTIKDLAGNAYAGTTSYNFTTGAAAQTLTGTASADTLTAGTGADTITALGGNDLLTGGAGNDALDGGTGLDTAVYSTRHAAYTLAHSGNGYSLSGPDGTDSLLNIERLQFLDAHLALDTDGTAGQIYRLYKAAFARTPDLSGLGGWIAAMDSGGTSLTQVASSFIASAEFQNLYGASPSNAQFVTALYLNVFGRAPDSGGFDYWVNQLASGLQTRAQALAFFSETGENKAATAPLTANGILYASAADAAGPARGQVFNGTSGADTLIGSVGNDTLSGGAGNDSLTGGAGIDIAIYGGTRASHTISVTTPAGSTSTGVANLGISGGTDGSDSLSGIERIKFDDGALAFDLNGNAGQTYRLYQAAFDRTPDTAGLSDWIRGMDTGMSLRTVASGFIGSAEFQGLYGANPSNTQFVDLLYANVLNRPADAAGYDYWLGQMQGGMTRELVLIGFSESAENQAALLPIIQNGISYVA